MDLDFTNVSLISVKNTFYIARLIATSWHSSGCKKHK